MFGVAKEMSDPRPAPEPRRTLARGILAYRWVALAWMITVALTETGGYRRPVIAWASIGGAAVWTSFLTLAGRRWRRPLLWLDLAMCGWLIIASGLVLGERQILTERTFFAVGYPLSAALLWGAVAGPVGGLAVGALLGAAFAATRPLNGVPLQSLPADEVRELVGGVLNFLVAGGAAGLVSRLLLRSSEALAAATDELVKARERAARLAERDSLARRIHDSVLQSLALVHKSGAELAKREVIPADEVAKLAELAGRQEAELRNLVLREPPETPPGLASLRAALESLGRSFNGLNVVVGAVGPIWLARATTEELSAAVKQAVDNVVEHARATRVTLFADHDGDRVLVSVRDDGIGFVYDEASLEAQGKAGILKSMKGRVEALEGRMTITTSPGAGTEVEFEVPARGAEG
jgi:signal transduction histidine kinase